MKVVLAGGGTAGHIEPALNLADEIMRRDSSSTVVALGTLRGLEGSLVPGRGYRLEYIPAVPLPRKPNLDLLSLPIRLNSAIKSARAIMRELNADVVVGFGGYVAMPAYFAARGQFPLVVHEANARPGLANRVGARFADAIAESVPGSLPNAIFTGNPLRAFIAELNRSESRAQARAYFGLNPTGQVLLVFGGSQGAHRINNAIGQAVRDGIFGSIQVLHAVGSKNNPPHAETENYKPISYIDRMDLAYAAADLALCRSGAMTVAEVSAVGLPSCFIPFPIGNGEQRLNCLAMVESGAALYVADEQFDAAYIREVIVPLISDTEKLNAMSQASKLFARPNAASRLADLVESVVK